MTSYTCTCKCYHARRVWQIGETVDSTADPGVVGHPHFSPSSEAVPVPEPSVEKVPETLMELGEQKKQTYQGVELQTEENPPRKRGRPRLQRDEV